MRSKSAPLFAALILAFAYVSLFFSRRTPVAIQNFLFFAVLLVEMVMIGAGWWYYRQVRSAADAAIWRKCMALIGVIANTTAFAIPFGDSLYSISIGVSSDLPTIDWNTVVLACLIFSLCGVVAGAMAPPRCRFATILGSIIMPLLVLAIPIAVL